MSRLNSISESQLRKIGIVYVYEDSPGITRVRRGRGFSFIAPDNTLIRDQQERTRLLAVAVPPSYENVWYCTKAEGHLQATGLDSQSKKQYFYHPQWKYLREKTKFRLMADFGMALPAFRRKIARKLGESSSPREKLICGMLRILDRTGLRMGNTTAAKFNKTYGLTTLLKRHIKTVDDQVLHFTFKGKGGSDIEGELSDSQVLQIISECVEIPGQRLFDYLDEQGEVHSVGSGDVNAYIKTEMREEFSAKDFRTWRFSCFFLEALLKRKKREQDFTLKDVLEETARLTYNTPAVLKSSYIHPGLLELARKKNLNSLKAPEHGPAGLRQSEQYLLKFLKTAAASRALEKLKVDPEK